MRRGKSGLTGQLHSGNDAPSAPTGWQTAFILVGSKSGSDLSVGRQAYCFNIRVQSSVELEKLRRSHDVSGAEGSA